MKFNFFGKPAESTNGTHTISNESQIQTTGAVPEVTEALFIEKEPSPISATPLPSKVEANSISTGENNITLLYKFLDKNYEEEGYNDALINPDSSHMAQNIEAIRNDLERMIKKVKIFYEAFIMEVDYHIDSRSRSGMVDIVAELKMKKEIAESQMKKVAEIERDAVNNQGDSQGIVISYTRGFKNGLAAISLDTILKKNL